MRHVYVHSTDPMLHETAALPHSGIWRYGLTDGSFIFALGTWHAATMRTHVARAVAEHPSAAIRPLPSVASGKDVAPSTLAAITAHAAAHGITSNLSGSTTRYVLDTIHALTGDPMFSSEDAP